MAQMRIARWIVLAGLVATLAAGAPVLAQDGVAPAGGDMPPAPAYFVDWYTVDGGGNAMTGGPYKLWATTGQPDAGLMTSASYTLAGGFWPGVPAWWWRYLPYMRR